MHDLGVEAVPVSVSHDRAALPCQAIDEQTGDDVSPAVDRAAKAVVRSHRTAVASVELAAENIGRPSNRAAVGRSAIQEHTFADISTAAQRAA